MNEKDGRGFYLVAEARYAYRPTLLEDRHMWRMLLAKLHPDAGGDHELFLFASALKEGVCSGRRLATTMSGGRSALRSTSPGLGKMP